jgi:hypothetical protein
LTPPWSRTHLLLIFPKPPNIARRRNDFFFLIEMKFD